jgi:hypothetical protein
MIMFFHDVISKNHRQMYMLTGCASPFHSDVYVSGHLKDPALAGRGHFFPLRVLPQKACGSRGLPHSQVIEMTKPLRQCRYNGKHPP